MSKLIKFYMKIAEQVMCIKAVCVVCSLCRFSYLVFFLHLVDVYSDVFKIKKDTVGKKENC